MKTQESKRLLSLLICFGVLLSLVTVVNAVPVPRGAQDPNTIVRMYSGSFLNFGLTEFGEIMPFHYPVGNDHLDDPLTPGAERLDGYTIAYNDGTTQHLAYSVYEIQSSNFIGGGGGDTITTDSITCVYYSELENSANRLVADIVTHTSDGNIEIFQRFIFYKAYKFIRVETELRNIGTQTLTGIVFKRDTNWEVDGDCADDSWNIDGVRNMIYAWDNYYVGIGSDIVPAIFDFDGYDITGGDGFIDDWSIATEGTVGPVAGLDGYSILHYNVGALIPGGTYNVTFVYAAGDTLVDLQNSADLGFAAASGPGNINGLVYYDENTNGIFDGIDIALQGANVYLDDVFNQVTDAFGNYSLSAPYGNHWVTVKLTGFYNQTKNVFASSASNAILNFGLIMADSITGRVIKADGTPIVGAYITAFPFGTQVVPATDVLGGPAVTVTDLFGNYVLKGLPPGIYDIRMRKQEFEERWLFNKQVKEDQYGNTITVKDASFTGVKYNYCAITGFVFGAGMPLAGAVVEIPGLGLSTTTEADGSYRLDGIPAGWYYVVAKMDGFKIGVQFVCIECVDCTTQVVLNPFHLEVLPDPCCLTGSLQGIVTDGKRPLEMAFVEIPGLNGFGDPPMTPLFTDKAGFYIFTDYTDPYGSYAQPGIPGGCYTVVVEHWACDPDDESDNYHKTAARLVTVGNGKLEVADFTLEENMGIIFGRVTNTDGIGVSGATVFVPNSPYSTITDENGYYFLEVPVETYSDGCEGCSIDEQMPDPGCPEVCGCEEPYRYPDPLLPMSAQPRNMYKAQYLVVVTMANYKEGMKLIAPFPGGTGNLIEEPQGCTCCNPCVYDFVLTPLTGIVKGSVVNAQGVPLNGMLVTIAGRERFTDEDGWFEIREVPVGSYTLISREPNGLTKYEVAVRTGITVSHLETTTLVGSKQIAMAAYTGTTAYLAGIVYQDKIKSGDFNPGEGIKDVLVTLEGATPQNTDTYGFYAMTIPQAVVSSKILVASKANYITATGLVGINPGSLVFDLPFIFNLLMEKQKGNLDGIVTNGEDPVLWAMLTIFGSNYDLNHNNVIADSEGEVHDRSDETDTNGYYIFTDLDVGRYLVLICNGGECGIDYKPLFAYVDVTRIVAHQDFVLVKKKGRIEGWVGDAANFPATPPPIRTRPYKRIPTPLVFADVIVSGKHQAQTDNEGYYTILNIPVGTHTVACYKQGYFTQKYKNNDNNVGVTVGVNVPDINFAMVPLSQPATTGSISGFVDLEFTDGFCNVRVTINETGQFVVTDSEGFYLILNVNPQTQQYTIHARLDGYKEQIQKASIVAGKETKNVNFSLKRWRCPAISGFVWSDNDNDEVFDVDEEKLAGAYVYLSGYLTGNAVASATTGSNGSFSLVNIPWGHFTAVATKNGYLTASYINFSGTNDIYMAWPDCLDPNIAIGLSRTTGAVYGWVKSSEDGSPVEGATVKVGDYTDTTDQDGYFKIPGIPPGAYVASASKSECGSDSYLVAVNYTMMTRRDFFLPCAGVSPGQPPSAPTLQSPANGSTNQSCTPTFTWNASAGATGYTLQVDNNSNFSSPEIAISTSNTFYESLISLAAFTQYYWRVCAANSNGTSPWSAVYSFTTGSCGAPTPDFTVSASPPTATITQGSSTVYTVSVESLYGFSDTVTLSLTGLPSGASPTFSPSQVTPTATSQLNISTTSSVAVGTYTLTITGTSGTKVRTANVTLEITAAGPPCTGNVCGQTIPGQATVKVYLAGHLKDSSAPLFYQTTSDVNGYFSFSLPYTAYDPFYEQDREPALYNIVVSKSGYATDFKSVKVASTQVTWYNKAGSTTDGIFNMSSSGIAVSGTVESGGSGLSAAAVRAFDLDYKGNLVKVGEANTDGNGDYALPTLLSGRQYWISASKLHYMVKTNVVSAATTSNDYNLLLVDDSSVVEVTIPLRYNPQDSLYDLGWNMVSISVETDANTPIPVLLYDLDEVYQQITRLRPGTGFTPPGHASGGAWEIYPNSYYATGTDQVFRMRETTYDGNPYRYGYWVKVKGTAEATHNWMIAGTPNTQKTIRLKAGWNLIGLGTQTNNQTFANGQITFSPNSVLQIWSYDAYSAGDSQLGTHWSAYVFGGYHSPGFTVMKIGLAYYVYVSQDCTMTYV